MLVCLAEFDCMKHLNDLKVYPDRFYTDFEVFRNEIIGLRDCTCIVILGGFNRFNRRVITNFLKGLMKRADAEEDTGVKAVYTFADGTVSGLYSYYKYRGDFTHVDVMRGWNVVRADVFPWTKLQSEPRECKRILSDYDKSDIAGLIRKYKETHVAEDDYIPLIRIPDVKALYPKVDTV